MPELQASLTQFPALSDSVRLSACL